MGILNRLLGRIEDDPEVSDWYVTGGHENCNHRWDDEQFEGMEPLSEDSWYGTFTDKKVCKRCGAIARKQTVALY